MNPSLIFFQLIIVFTINLKFLIQISFTVQNFASRITHNTKLSLCEKNIITNTFFLSVPTSSLSQEYSLKNFIWKIVNINYSLFILFLLFRLARNSISAYCFWTANLFSHFTSQIMGLISHDGSSSISQKPVAQFFKFSSTSNYLNLLINNKIKFLSYPLAAVTELTMGYWASAVVSLLLDLSVFGGGIPNLLVGRLKNIFLNTRWIKNNSSKLMLKHHKIYNCSGWGCLEKNSIYLSATGCSLLEW